METTFNLKESSKPAIRNSDDELEINPEVARASGAQKGTSYTDTNTKNIWNDSIRLVQELNNFKNKGKKPDLKKLRKRFNFLNTTYPSIFNMLTNGSENYENMGTRMKRLKQMLDRIESVKRGEQTIEEAHNAVGTQYAREFMPAELMRPPK